MIQLLLCCFFLTSLAASELDDLRKERKWGELIVKGEQKLEESDLTDQWIILDELVSAYFFLGDYEKAKTCADSLLSIGSKLDNPRLRITSLYKLSAVFRGEGFFEKAKEFSLIALEQAQEKCPDDLFLKIQILFNAGAAECDNPQGDFAKGVSFYEEAVDLFSSPNPNTLLSKEKNYDDFYHRLLIRLGKGYFLLGKHSLAASILDKLSTLPLEKRTLMHFIYLKAQVLKESGFYLHSIRLCQEGLAIAIELYAKVDEKRFNDLLAALSETLH